MCGGAADDRTEDGDDTGRRAVRVRDETAEADARGRQNATASCTSAVRRGRRGSTAIDLYFSYIDDDELVLGSSARRRVVFIGHRRVVTQPWTTHAAVRATATIVVLIGIVSGWGKISRSTVAGQLTMRKVADLVRII